MVDVLLVSMPFGDAFSPSIALSLLQPQLRRRDLTCDIVYFTLPFAELIGQDLYCSLATNRHGSLCDLTGEWIFSDSLFARGPDAERGTSRTSSSGARPMTTRSPSVRFRRRGSERFWAPSGESPNFSSAASPM